MATRQDITRSLSSHIEARAGVANELVPPVYDEPRFFAGLSVKETAHELGVSTETVKRDGRFATAWLRARLKDEGAR